MNKKLRLSISFHLTDATSRSHVHTPVCIGRERVGMDAISMVTIKPSKSGGDHAIHGKLAVTIKRQIHYQLRCLKMKHVEC